MNDSADPVEVLIQRLPGNDLPLPAPATDHASGFDLRACIEAALTIFADVDKLLTENPIFRERMEGTGRLPAERLIQYGVTGPLLRAAAPRALTSSGR